MTIADPGSLLVDRIKAKHPTATATTATKLRKRIKVVPCLDPPDHHVRQCFSFRSISFFAPPERGGLAARLPRGYCPRMHPPWFSRSWLSKSDDNKLKKLPIVLLLGVVCAAPGGSRHRLYHRLSFLRREEARDARAGGEQAARDLGLAGSFRD